VFELPTLWAFLWVGGGRVGNYLEIRFGGGNVDRILMETNELPNGHKCLVNLPIWSKLYHFVPKRPPSRFCLYLNFCCVIQHCVSEILFAV
jgi:hypothetical protein